MYSVYILYSATLEKFYIGYSGDVSSRLAYHNDVSRNSIWTKRGVPWALFLKIDHLDKSQAMKIEKYIKKMKSKQYISNLKKYPEVIGRLKKKFG